MASSQADLQIMELEMLFDSGNGLWLKLSRLVEIRASKVEGDVHGACNESTIWP